MMEIKIDERSGFCPGVSKTIKIAEQELAKGEPLFCLGDIVHNAEEVNRLAGLGLEVINADQYFQLRDCKVLIRTHGEPKETYEYARKNNITLIEGTCKVVLSVQKKISEASNELINGGQIVIFGKSDHAEVRGLVGHTKIPVCVVENEESINELDTNQPVRLFAQTTMDSEKYSQISNLVRSKFDGEDIDFRAMPTICGQVSNRGRWLEEFCTKVEAVIFVGGRKSSNSKVLYEICKTANQNSFFVANKTDLLDLKLSQYETVGICGATSTPQWLIKEIAQTLSAKYNKE